MKATSARTPQKIFRFWAIVSLTSNCSFNKRVICLGITTLGSSGPSSESALSWLRWGAAASSSSAFCFWTLLWNSPVSKLGCSSFFSSYSAFYSSTSSTTGNASESTTNSSLLAARLNYLFLLCVICRNGCSIDVFPRFEADLWFRKCLFSRC